MPLSDDHLAKLCYCPGLGVQYLLGTELTFCGLSQVGFPATTDTFETPEKIFYSTSNIRTSTEDEIA